MILNREQLADAIRVQIGDDTSEETTAFVENIMETYDDLNKRTVNPDEYVPKSELDKINKEWEKKYRDRFFEPIETPIVETENKNNNNNNANKNELTYEKLFTKE